MAARRRFSVAAAKDHDVLLTDEAAATGDRSFRKRSEARIREPRKHAGTVFLVSHDDKSIRDTCDRVLWPERGGLRMDGPAGRGPEGVRGVHGRHGKARSQAEAEGHRRRVLTTAASLAGPEPEATAVTSWLPPFPHQAQPD
jgi:teichoic acid transport system ATP-binding protein